MIQVAQSMLQQCNTQHVNMTMCYPLTLCLCCVRMAMMWILRMHGSCGHKSKESVCRVESMIRKLPLLC